MLTEIVFSGLVLLLGLQRLLELTVSQRNARAMLDAGAIEHAPEQMPWMKLLHGSWLVACVVEVWLLDRPVHAWLALGAGMAFVCGQLLRVLAIAQLGRRWTARIITPVAGATVVDSGLFRVLRHPNYLGVCLEILALPLIHSAYITAVAFSIANGVLLLFRIRAEERALTTTSDYAARMGPKPRLIPTGLRQR